MAFTEFFCRSGGSNLNGGGLSTGAEPPTTAAYTSTNGAWSTTTHKFTPSDGSNPSLTVSVGDWASIYIDGASVAVCTARVTAVTNAVNGDITVSGASFAGAFPTTSATTRSIKVGGAWKGPNGTDMFPFTMASMSGMTDASSNKPRINLKNDQTYSVTATLTIGSGSVVQGYSSTVDDLGKATIDGGTTGASYNLVSFSSSGMVIRDLIIQNNGATGNQTGLAVTGGGQCHRVVVNSVRGYGISVSSGSGLIECEVYSANQNNTLAGINCASTGLALVRCISHNNNGAGFQGSGTFAQCISDTNTGAGFSISSLAFLEGCVAYNNSGAGITVTGGSSFNHFENCLAVNNGTYGLSTTTAIGLAAINCGFFGNTTAATSYASGTPVYESGTITLAADPFVDAPNGDFSLNTAETIGTGRGKFTQTAASYTGTESFTDLGSAQHEEGTVVGVSPKGGSFAYVT